MKRNVKSRHSPEIVVSTVDSKNALQSECLGKVSSIRDMHDIANPSSKSVKRYLIILLKEMEILFEENGKICSFLISNLLKK